MFDFRYRRRRYARTELEVETFDQVLAQLAAAQLFDRRIILGDHCYDAGYADQLTDQVIQPALRLPGGIGAVNWNGLDMVGVQDQSQIEREAIERFTHFADCSIAIKALIAPQRPLLLARLFQALQSL